MIDIDNANSLNVLSNILERKSVDFFNCGITFYLQIQNTYGVKVFTYDDVSDISNELLNKLDTYLNKHLLLIIDLFDYLLENNYIVATKDDFKPSFNMGCKLNDSDGNSLDFSLDEDMRGKFIEYARQKYFVTKKLKDLVENDYITESEKKYQNQVLLTNRQLKYTLIGLGITAISLFVSIFFNIYQISNKDINEIKITNDKLYIALDEIEQKSSQEQMKIIKQEVSEQMKEFQKEVGKYQKPDSKDKVEQMNNNLQENQNIIVYEDGEIQFLVL